MDKKQHMVPLKELNLTNRFLFDQVMEDREIQEDVLSIILGRDIRLIMQGETEKELRVSTLAKSIRMDVFSIDEEDTVYNTEMQSTWKNDLAKRSRYYQSLLDASLLEPGAPSYHLLNDSYLIMIMTFDLFGLGKYRYTFRPKCEEAENCRLEDGSTRIFLNTKGTNEEKVSKELVEFLRYVENTTDQEAGISESQRIRRIHSRVCRVRSNEEIGVKYMQAWEEKYYEREEGWKEGLEEGRKEGHREGLEEGRKEGVEEGKKEGQRETLRLMEEKLSGGSQTPEIERALEEIRGLLKEVEMAGE